LPTSALIGLVILLSLALTGYELFKIFGRDVGRTLRNRWALLAGFLNLITALIVWFIVHNLLAIEPSLPSALVTGLTFPALLRSRFTLYRSIGAAETEEVNELSLKMDQIYHDLQRALYKEVNIISSAAECWPCCSNPKGGRMGKSVTSWASVSQLYGPISTCT